MSTLIKSGRAIFSYLPSLLPFSVVTALTRTETSVQVLDPSQWARQTAPLPNETQVRSVVADKRDTSEERVQTKGAAKHISIKMNTYQCASVQLNGK